MVKKADVVISNFLPGTMDKLGIGFPALSNIKPDLVYVENSGFGKGGPYSAYPCFDPIAKAVIPCAPVFSSPEPKQEIIPPSVYQCGNRIRLRDNSLQREIHTPWEKSTPHHLREAFRRFL